MRLKLGVCQRILAERMRSDTTAADKAETQRLLLAFDAGNLEPLLETITLREVTHDSKSSSPAAERAVDDVSTGAVDEHVGGSDEAAA